MVKNVLKNRIIAFSLLVIFLVSCITQPSHSKYVYTETGRAMASILSGNFFTDTFVVTDELLTNSDGTFKGSATSNALFGINTGSQIDLNNQNGSYTIGSYSEDYKLDSTSNLSFVIHNGSSHTIVACFDVILCMGWIRSNKLTCTISAPTDNAESTDKVNLVLTAGLGEDTDIKLKHHKESSDNGSSGEGTDTPIIDVNYSNFFGLADYSAYSFHLDPTATTYRDETNINDPADNKITIQELQSFLLVPSGATRTFDFSFAGQGNWASDIDLNAFASIAMTAKVVTDPELLTPAT